MNMTVSRERLVELVTRQVENNFLLDPGERETLAELAPGALEAMAPSIGANANKYFSDEADRPLFSPYHSGQYTIFLYHMSRQAYLTGENQMLADKLYYLNKMLNACDVLYGVELPEIVFFEHPVGTVLGRATYSDYLVVQQNCTVGGNRGVYPRLGEFVWLFADASVIGDCTIGDNVFVSAGACVVDTDIPDNTIVFGRTPNLTMKQRPPRYFLEKSPFRSHRAALAE